MRPAIRVGGLTLVCGFLALGVTGCSSAEPVVPDLNFSTDEAPQKKFDGTIDEYLVALGSCIREAGYEITVYDQRDDPMFPSIDPPDDLPEAQGDAYDETLYACFASVGYYGIDQSRAELEATYAALMSRYDCLEAAGWAMPDRPTLQEGLAQYEAEKVFLEDPLGFVPVGERSMALKECPAVMY